MPDDAKHLIRLCEAGRLYAIERWVTSGGQLKTPKELRKTPLGVALRTGFHSLIELLLRHEDSQEAKNGVLAQALKMRRPDLVELAVAYGAETASVSFADVLLSWDRRTVSFFLERGADPVADFPFAHAFHERVRTALGCYLDCKRSRPKLVAQLQEQADIALRQFSRDGNLKWVSLLMWAGADPRSRGPTLEYLDDPDMSTTALDDACTFGHLEVVKRLKPDRNRDELGGPLRSAALFARTEIMSYLLGLGANPNDKSNGGSSVLDGCIRQLGWEDFDAVSYRRNRQTPAYRACETREAVRVLIENGAVWKPDDSLNDVRRTLYGIDPEVTVELVGLLVKHHACNDATLHDLLRTPRMQQHMESCERRLWRVGLTLDGQRKSETREARNAPPSPYLLSRYDREQLYNEVSSGPTQKVAAQYGISDAGLGKVCRQLKIPKPPRGYWAKKAAGRPVPRRPKLPVLEDAKHAGRKRRTEHIR